MKTTQQKMLSGTAKQAASYVVKPQRGGADSQLPFQVFGVPCPAVRL